MPRIEKRRADVTYRITATTRLPASSHSRADDPDDPWAIEHWMGTRLAVEFPGWATFELSSSDITLVRAETDDPDLVAHLLLDHVLPRVVSLRGDVMLHAAGAVGPSGRAHLFLGGTGAGKSTLVTQLASHGWALLDDDCIRVINIEKGFWAVPGAEGIRLLPDTAAAVLPGVQAGRPLSDSNPKRRFAIDGRLLRMATDATPIAGVYLLARIDVSQPSVERLGFGDSLSTITEHGFHMAEEPASITRQAFERASALAASTAVWRLFCPDNLGQLALTHALLADLDCLP